MRFRPPSAFLLLAWTLTGCGGDPSAELVGSYRLDASLSRDFTETDLANQGGHERERAEQLAAAMCATLEGTAEIGANGEAILAWGLQGDTREQLQGSWQLEPERRVMLTPADGGERLELAWIEGSKVLVLATEIDDEPAQLHFVFQPR
jgi:hypothetical protein